MTDRKAPTRQRVIKALELQDLRSRAETKAMSVMAHDLMDIVQSNDDSARDTAIAALWCLISQIEGR